MRRLLLLLLLKGLVLLERGLVLLLLEGLVMLERGMLLLRLLLLRGALQLLRHEALRQVVAGNGALRHKALHVAAQPARILHAPAPLLLPHHKLTAGGR